MNTVKCISTAVLLLTAAWTHASITLSQSFSGGTIADGDPAGVVFSGTFNQANPGDHILGVTVGLNISGGYNGDLYAYLVAPNGTLVALFNQPGASAFGAGGAGMNITLQSGTSTYGSIQTAGDGYLTGSYNASGSLLAFGTSESPGGAANGTWSLFFADMSSGGGTATLNSWSLELTVVPEPVTLALGLFVVMLVALAGLKWVWRTRRRRPCILGASYRR